MLAKSARLTTAQFDEYFKQGQRFHSTHLQVIWHQSETFHGAVVVGKKISKRAVDRNRLRRRLYSVLYALSRQESLRGIYIVLTKPTAKHIPYAELKLELETVISRIRKKQLQ